MRIAIVNKWGRSGGAAKAAYRLHEALLKNNVKSSYFYEQGCLNDLDNCNKISLSLEDVSSQSLIQKLYIDSNRSPISNTYFSYSGYSIEKGDLESILRHDLINLHWVEHLISTRDLKHIVESGKPIVWTLHDMKPFTGGCHYTAGCKMFESSCKNCRQLIWDPFSIPNRILQEKYAILSSSKNITIVSPSTWLAERAKESKIFSHLDIHVIPNSLPIDVYERIEKSKAKSFLNIGDDVLVIQFGAHNANEKRKGFEYLAKACDILYSRHKHLCDSGKIAILCLGEASKELELLPFKVINLGYVSDENKISVAYNATDMYVLPSLEDNLPNTMLESMATGTPIVAFNSGGIGDLVINNETGLLVEPRDFHALSNAISMLIECPATRLRLGNNSYNLVREKCTPRIQAINYKNLFKSLICNRADTENSAEDIELVHEMLAKNLNIIENKMSCSYRDLHMLRQSYNDIVRTSFFYSPMRKLKLYRKLVREVKRYLSNIDLG